MNLYPCNVYQPTLGLKCKGGHAYGTDQYQPAPKFGVARTCRRCGHKSFRYQGGNRRRK